MILLRFLNTSKVALLLFVLSSVNTAPSTSKIDEQLKKAFEAKETVAVFLNFKAGTEEVLKVASSQIYKSRIERLNFAAEVLQSHAEATQKSIKEFLGQKSISYESFWISNQIYLPATTWSIVNQLSDFPEISAIVEEGVSYIEDPKISQVFRVGPKSARETQWGISKIQADRVWGTAGHTGVGIVVGVIDTGVRGSHQDLRINYRTPYGWRDPYNSAKNATPDDGSGHGTHTTGTIIGSNGIGVAPGAKWIACKGCTASLCHNSHLVMCGQWMLCPTLTDGTEPDCSKAPHLVSNSWAGGQGNPIFNSVVIAWKAANIIPIFAQGNAGPSCNTALSPGDSDVIAVGATSEEDNIASFSGKGPSIFGTLKPDISAPGMGIYSSFSRADDAYTIASGTSMATPHVAGAVALILSRRANMTYEEVKHILFSGADRAVLTECTEACGGIEGSVYPNNCYGHGRLNVYNSVMSIS